MDKALAPEWKACKMSVWRMDTSDDRVWKGPEANALSITRPQVFVGYTSTPQK